MKKHIIICILGLMSGLMTQAQEGNHVNAGVGLNGLGIPLYGSFDWAFKGDFNLGVGGSITLNADGSNGGSSSSEVALGAGFFTQWYADRLLELPGDFDAYAGGGVFLYTGPGDDVDLSIFIGGRYYFNSNMAFNLELGGGSALAGGKAGISWRI